MAIETTGQQDPRALSNRLATLIRSLLEALTILSSKLQSTTSMEVVPVTAAYPAEV